VGETLFAPERKKGGIGKKRHEGSLLYRNYTRFLVRRAKKKRGERQRLGSKEKKFRRRRKRYAYTKVGRLGGEEEGGN